MYGKPRARRKNSRALLAAVAALVLCLWLENSFVAGPEPEPEFISGRVTAVHDGDTFTMIGSSRQKIKVRLFGVDAPELGQAHGPESGRYLRELALGREVRVEDRGHDQYGRLLGMVHRPDGSSLTHELVAAGQVWVYENYCDAEPCAWLRRAQKEARAAGRGLWSDPKPVAPWTYRRAGK